MDLNNLLDNSAPPVTTRDQDLQRTLNELVMSSEAAASKSRRPVRFAVVGGTLAGLLGVGAVAGATGVLPGWPAMETPSGQTCNVTIHADATVPGYGEPIAATFSDSQREATLAEATEYLDSFDFESVDRDTAIDWWQSEEDRVRADQPDPAERQQKLHGDDLMVTAYSFWVIDQLRSHLHAEGLDIRAISINTSTTGCQL